jgi:hypothetical protein
MEKQRIKVIKITGTQDFTVKPDLFPVK